jgi:DNA-directed RNA polymerase subunit RPC12/RpoP
MHAEKRKGKRPIEQEATPTPYTCRFCGREFEKRQALGGHMNCHYIGKNITIFY